MEDGRVANARQRRRQRVRKIALALVVLAVFSAIAGAFAVITIIGTQRERYGGLDTQKLTQLPLTTTVHNMNGEKVTSLHGLENRISVQLSAVPEIVRNAFIAAEDLRFYNHGGVDWIRVAGAAVHDLRTGSLSQGASTLTQQLIKLTHLSSEKTWPRKIYEAWLAIEAEGIYTKDEILSMYLNTVYFGAGAYGIEAASQIYFGKHTAELSVAESALLAGVMKSPTRYAPHIQPENAVTRRNLVLGTMLENEMISQEEYDRAIDEELSLALREDDSGMGWYIDQVVKEACALLGVDADELHSGGYRIYTALNSSVQAEFEDIFMSGDYFPPNASDGTPCQGSATLIDPATGAVRALVGGREYSARRGMNRATDAYRQPGSSLKPLAVYAPAFEKMGVLPSDIVYDEPTDFGGYSPGNFGGTFLGPITLRTAAAKSQNVPAVWLLNQMGVNASRESLTRFGITLHKDDVYLPLALGAMTTGTTTWELASGYSALANNGLLMQPHTIERIEGPDGALLYAFSEPSTRAVSPEAAYFVTDMLKSAAIWGTAKPLGALGYPIAAKTGTVGQQPSGNRDAWTVAYTPAASLAVWMGFDNPSAEHAMPASATGGGIAAKLAAALMAAAHPSGEGDGDFYMPFSIRQAEIDLYTLEHEHIKVLANELTPDAYRSLEPFWPGTEPTSITTYWRRPSAPSVFAIEPGEGGLPFITIVSQDEAARYRVYRRLGESAPVEVVALVGEPGQALTYLDTHATRGETFAYYVVAEHALAQDAGIDTRSLPGPTIYFRVPIIAPTEVLPSIPMPQPTPRPSSESPFFPILPDWLVPR